ncbi:anthrone oxygenase family protein [Ensifer soli]|uniref:anthrone oxygenase family protein n=1 Tax=Ciceribacter sp. sgz301302 TaxID=3342379 RepID=UPI0035B8CB4A
MLTIVYTLCLWGAAIGCGLIAGVYFAFSAFVMRALSALPPESGAAAMQSINEVILRSAFMPLFVGTTLAALALVGIGIFRWGTPGAPEAVLGGATYVTGMVIVTLAFNVPLNSLLAGAAGGPEAAKVWSRYLSDWTFWNHVRTGASLAACLLFTLSIRAD